MRFAIPLAATFLAIAVADPLAAQQTGGARQQAALLIGNAKYPDSEAPLKEPVNDARALADELRRDGFGAWIRAKTSRAKGCSRRSAAFTASSGPDGWR